MMDEDLRAVSSGLAGASTGVAMSGTSEDDDLETVLSAYRAGLFPMGLGEGGGPPIGWWTPTLRGVLLPGELIVSRSLRRSRRQYHCTVDEDFAGVVAGCADPARAGGWITAELQDLYQRLHARGEAHSIEVRADGGDLVGGLFGIRLGRVFIGESMFHSETDASKVALVELAERLTTAFGDTWTVDVQWSTPHLESLGVSEMTGLHYLERLRHAEVLDGSEVFDR